MEKKTHTISIDDYSKKSAFASFLPGIAGIKGIPIWCYYVNRGQGVVSFGIDNKDHAIMEFFPAHQAYKNVSTTGFRTFLRRDGKYFEAFTNPENPHVMSVAMNSLSITETDIENQIKTKVTYSTLPEEKLGGLIRRVTFTNLSDTDCSLEILDGMPEIIPFGVGQDSMKNMTQTCKAWMQAEDLESKVPFYRVRASMEDSASVVEIEGGNFSFARTEDGFLLDPIVDTKAIFDFDLSLKTAYVLKEEGIKGVYGRRQNLSNILPCSFYGTATKLAAKGEFTIYELIGQAASREIVNHFMCTKPGVTYFEEKLSRANELTDDLCSAIETKTGNDRFDEYCRYTFMDNVLRGGYPLKLGNNKTFYVYSRKHGDLERDYNYFSMADEYYSQGNGNFRDVNQNRRCDTFFAPYVGRQNIELFYNLIQLDGYNPLAIEKITYVLKDNLLDSLMAGLPAENLDAIRRLVTKPFTPGALARLLENLGDRSRQEEVFTTIIDFAEPTVNASFGEGYWSDHWDYNLDLIEEYLAVFPEKEKEMLYDKNYTYFLSQANINPRSKRYAKTDKGIRQYFGLNENNKRDGEEKLVRADYGRGAIVKTTLLEKLILMCACKYAALDPYGMGIEMEGGKPGWYDALNGLPGLLGSSMAETYELKRMLDYTILALEKHGGDLELLEELDGYINNIYELTVKEKSQLELWNGINDAKENYRELTYAGISGKTITRSTTELKPVLEVLRTRVEKGIARAFEIGKGIVPTYFYYDVTAYTEDEAGIHPTAFEQHQVPMFLEGPVRYMRLEGDKSSKAKLYDMVKNSDLYDSKLQMYKVNASLENASYELGRCRAFTPGWLENESIWLHMEYKYLLEILRSGLYEQFFDDIKTAFVPFMDEDVYGRSTLENSSFIASSKNPDESIHGKGFVARLSGSTIEFISMWKMMMFGPKPFTCKANNELQCSFEPAIPSYLIGEDLIVTATFLGKTKVTYRLPDQENLVPGNYRITKITLKYMNQAVAQLETGCLTGKLAKDLRDGVISSVDVEITR